MALQGGDGATAEVPRELLSRASHALTDSLKDIAGLRQELQKVGLRWGGPRVRIVSHAWHGARVARGTSGTVESRYTSMIMPTVMP